MKIILQWLAALTIFFAPIYTIMLAVGFIIFIDTITGVYAAYKKGEVITSRKLGNMIVKILLYNLALISAFVCETILTPIVPFVKVTTFVIAVTEFKSIAENVYKATGLNIWNRLKEFVNRKKES